MIARLVTALVLVGSTAFAQPVDDRPARRLEVAVGGLWLAGAAMGDERAELRSNASPPGSFTLFTTSNRMTSAPGADARLGFWLTKSLAVEGGFNFSQPELRTFISGDAEGAPTLTVGEQIDQYVIDVSGVWLIDRFRIGGRTVPFIAGGGGYLRQLHEGRTLIETGQVYHAGGGVRHWLRLRDTGFLRGMGFRADARLYVLVNGIALKDRPRSHGAISGSMFFTF